MDKFIKSQASEGNNDVVIQKLNPLPSNKSGGDVYLIQVSDQNFYHTSLQVPKIIKELLDKGFAVTVTNLSRFNTVVIQQPVYRIEGFAKATYLYLEETENGGLIAKGRYHYSTRIEIKSFDDILNIARECHKWNPDYGISKLFYEEFMYRGWIQKKSAEIYSSAEYVV